MNPSIAVDTDEVAADVTVRRSGANGSGSHFGGLDSELYGDRDFDGALAASHAGDVILTRLEANRHRVLRTPQMARSSEAAYLKIVAPWQGAAAVQQRAERPRAREGAGSSTTRPMTTRSRTGACRPLIVMVPKASAGGARPAAGLSWWRAASGGASGISRVALETMRNTYLELPYMSEVGGARRGRTHHPAGAAVADGIGRAGERPRTQREALKDRTEPARRGATPARLNPIVIDGIAQALLLQQAAICNSAFAGDERHRWTSYILHQRLWLSACPRTWGPVRTLGAADHRHRAGLCFENLSHFSRVFREHTGGSPSEFRRQAARR